MKSAILLLAVTITAAAANRGRWSPEARACFQVMRPDDVFENMQANTDKCVAEQSGLQAVIDGLTSPAEEHSAKRRPGRQYRGGRGRSRGLTFDLLEKNGHGEAARALRICVARYHGNVNSDDTFNIAGFHDNLRTRVAGSEQETNVRLGIDNCPTDALADFKIREYMKCVQAYCVTGEAPLQ